MITADIQRFSTHLAAIYANLAKPILDVILYNYQLSQNVGAEGLVILTILVQCSAALRGLSSCQLMTMRSQVDIIQCDT
jgi:ATP-binding cassette subfamily D (ALD) long-chain fatty acid import protein